MNYSWGRAYANGFVVLVERLDVFRLGTIASGDKIIPLQIKISWMDVWECNPEGLG
jgi:hypothetical protein